jgi:hypothetical protein
MRWARSILAGALAVSLVALMMPPLPAEAEEKDPDKEACISDYVRCQIEDWEGPCGDCLHKCITQKSWPSDRCFPRKFKRCPKKSSKDCPNGGS